MQPEDKILIWDIEASNIELRHQQYDLSVNFKRFSPDSIVRDWNIFSIAWKWLGKDKTDVISISPRNPTDDKEVVKYFHSILTDAPIILGHNSDAFDLKKFNARAIYHGLDPIPQKQQIDTLKIARKYFKFTSNKLSYLADYLGVSAKDDSPDWDKVLSGDAEEIRTMRAYNKQDCIVTEQIYLKMRGWHHNHPNMALHLPIKDISGLTVISCKKCNSTNCKLNGNRYTQARKIQRYKCLDCGGTF